MLDKIEFLNEYKIKDAFLQSNLDWNTLESIYDDYSKYEIKLHENNINNKIVSYIKDGMNCNIHSINTRLKSQEHLIEKIIRKRGIEQSYKYKPINKDNYKDIIKDLIGIRIITLSKEEWEGVHDWLISKFPDDNTQDIFMEETPQAYTRYGDRDIFKDKILKEHTNKGYRSQHYIINFQGYYCEIQVRTLSEEVFGEFDHKVKYPYRNNNNFLIRYTNMVSQFLNSVDEMISTCFQLKEQGWDHCEGYYDNDNYIDWKNSAQTFTSVQNPPNLKNETKHNQINSQIDIASYANSFILRKDE